MSALLIDTLRLWRYRVPFRQSVVTSRHHYRYREGLLIAATTSSGVTGFGEIAPLPGFSRETVENLIPKLQSLLPRLQESGVDPNAEPQELVNQLDRIIGTSSPSIRFGTEAVAADIYSQARGLPIREAWFDGGSGIEEVEVNSLLTNDPSELEAQLDELLNMGFSTFKLKVGSNPESDMELITIIRNRIGPDRYLRLDANRGFEFSEADRFISSIAEFGIDYIEEPLANPSVQALSELSSGKSTAIALDETIAEWRDGGAGSLVMLAEDDLVKSGCFQVAILKPALLGGLREVYDAVLALGQQGITSVITSALDSAIGVTAAAQLAGALGNRLPACGLATSSRLESSLAADPLNISGGRLILPRQPGLGARVEVETSIPYLEEIDL